MKRGAPSKPARQDARGSRLTGYDIGDYDQEVPAGGGLPYPTARGPYHCVSAKWIGNNDPRKVAFGHGLHLAVSMPGPDDSPDDFPLVAVAMELTAATGNPSQAMHRMLLRATKRGVALGDVAADNAFFPKGEHALAIKALGGSPIFHLHQRNQQGPRNDDGQAVWIDGRPYCTCIPERLKHLVYPRFPQQKPEREGYRKLLAERIEYEFKPHGVADPTGYQRWSSPHGGPSGKKCGPCGTKRQCCSQRTVKFKPVDLALVQPHVFGSEAWQRSYDRRTLVEGFFGSLKTFTKLAHGSVRFHRHGRVALAYALMVAATNLHLVTTWLARRSARRNKPAVPAKRRRSTPKPTLSDYIPTTAGHVQSSAPPTRTPRGSALAFLDE